MVESNTGTRGSSGGFDQSSLSSSAPSGGQGDSKSGGHRKHLKMCVMDFLGAASLLVQGKFEITKMDMKVGTTLKIKGKIADDADR